MGDYRVTAATAFCRNRRHGVGEIDVMRTHDLEIVISAPDTAALHEITALVFADYRIELQHFSGSACHHSHADPLLVFHNHGEAHFSVMLYEPEALTGNGDLVKIEFADAPALIQKAGWQPDLVKPKDINSKIVKDNKGRRSIEIDVRTPAVLIWQFVRFGRYTEIMEHFDVGCYEIPLPQSYGEYYGIALSADIPFGGVENKHMLQGHMGMGSGRHLLRLEGGIVTSIAPKSPRGYEYKAAVLYCESLAELAAFMPALELCDEVEVFTPDDVEFTLPPLPCPSKHTKIGRGLEADILLIDYGDVPPLDRVFTYGLFLESGGVSFALHLEAILKISQTMPSEALWFERCWLDARFGVMEGAENTPTYGVGFASSANFELNRAKVLEQKRRILRNSPCYDCAKIGLCNNLLSFPWPEGEKGKPAIIEGGFCVVRDI